jgi:type I restriction-modification system DNA methylase subunit
MARDELKRVRGDLRSVAEYIDEAGRVHGRDKAFRWFIEDCYASITGRRKEDPPPADQMPMIAEAGRAYGHALEQAEPFEDLLSEVFMALAPPGNWLGQNFTPTGVCDLLAHMQCPDLIARAEQAVREGDHLVRINDPACGAGAMLLAVARRLSDRPELLAGISLSGTDLDSKAARLTAIQLAGSVLKHRLTVGEIAVIHGNTLTMESYGVAIHLAREDVADEALVLSGGLRTGETEQARPKPSQPNATKAPCGTLSAIP